MNMELSTPFKCTLNLVDNLSGPLHYTEICVPVCTKIRVKYVIDINCKYAKKCLCLFWERTSSKGDLNHPPVKVCEPCALEFTEDLIDFCDYPDLVTVQYDWFLTKKPKYSNSNECPDKLYNNKIIAHKRVTFTIKCCLPIFDTIIPQFQKEQKWCIDSLDATENIQDRKVEYKTILSKGPDQFLLTNSPQTELLSGDCNPVDLSNILFKALITTVGGEESPPSFIKIGDIIDLSGFPHSAYPLLLTLVIQVLYNGPTGELTLCRDCKDCVIKETINQTTFTSTFTICGKFESECVFQFETSENQDEVGSLIADELVSGWNESTPPGSEEICVDISENIVNDITTLLYNIVFNEECCDLVIVDHNIRTLPVFVSDEICKVEEASHTELQLEPCQRPIRPREIILTDCKLFALGQCIKSEAVYISEIHFTVKIINNTALAIVSSSFNVLVKLEGNIVDTIPIPETPLDANQTIELPFVRSFPPGQPGLISIEITTDITEDTFPCILTPTLPPYPCDICRLLNTKKCKR